MAVCMYVYTAFARGKDLFASVGADGSVRMFDLRSLVHSTIIYEVCIHTYIYTHFISETPPLIVLLYLPTMYVFMYAYIVG